MAQGSGGLREPGSGEERESPAAADAATASGSSAGTTDRAESEKKRHKLFILAPLSVCITVVSIIAIEQQLVQVVQAANQPFDYYSNPEQPPTSVISDLDLDIVQMVACAIALGFFRHVRDTKLAYATATVTAKQGAKKQRGPTGDGQKKKKTDGDGKESDREPVINEGELAADKSLLIDPIADTKEEVAATKDKSPAIQEAPASDDAV